MLLTGILRTRASQANKSAYILGHLAVAARCGDVPCGSRSVELRLITGLQYQANLLRRRLEVALLTLVSFGSAALMQVS